jgi:rhodanese-related sulfurtransferase
LRGQSLALIAKRLSGERIFLPCALRRKHLLSQEDGDRPVENVDVEATWGALKSRAGSQLVDVRTRAEWTYVGIPDLGSLNKRAVLIEWQTFPDQTVDPRFAERLAGELKVLGVKLDDDLFFICRSGGRSLAAAKAMAAMGYRSCYNVAGGFEGPLDDERHRGTVGGWRAAGLPWLQG